MTPQIRPMRRADIQRVYEIECACFRTPWSRLSLLSELRNRAAVYLVAEAEGRVMGYGGMWVVLDEAHVTNIAVMEQAHREGKTVVRLHTGDPCVYGAIREQMDLLEEKGIPYEVCPGVSAFCGAAAALGMEYTLPGISQSVVITRMAGATPVPERESIASFAAHGATMVVFLSTGLLEQLSRELMAGGYRPDTPAAIVYKAT